MEFPYLVFEKIDEEHSDLLGYFESEDDAKLYTTVNNNFNNKNQFYTTNVEDLNTGSYNRDYVERYADCVLYEHTFSFDLSTISPSSYFFSIDALKSISKTDYTTKSEYIVFSSKAEADKATDLLYSQRDGANKMTITYKTYSTDESVVEPTKKYFKTIDELVDKLFIETAGNDSFNYDSFDDAKTKLLKEYEDLSELNGLIHKYPEESKEIVDKLPNTDVIEVDDSINKVDADSVDNIVNVLNDDTITKAKITIKDDIVATSAMTIPTGKSIEVNLDGKTIKSSNNVFNVNPGATLTISGGGTIGTTNHNKNAVVVDNGVLNLENTTIDNSTDTDNTDHNYAYGIYVKEDGIVNIKDATIHTIEASAISSNNTTGIGEINISGNSMITTDGCAAIYLANSDTLTISDNAMVSSIFARMGTIKLKGNAKVINSGGTEVAPYFNIGALAAKSGVEKIPQAILAEIGMYNGNNTKFRLIADEGVTISAKDGEALAIGKVDTLAATDALVELGSSVNFRVYSHDDLATLAREAGKTLRPAVGESDVMIKVQDTIVYPMVV